MERIAARVKAVVDFLARYGGAGIYWKVGK
jgi:hypothetical protein